MIKRREARRKATFGFESLGEREREREKRKKKKTRRITARAITQYPPPPLTLDLRTYFHFFSIRRSEWKAGRSLRAVSFVRRNVARGWSSKGQTMVNRERSETRRYRGRKFQPARIAPKNSPRTLTSSSTSLRKVPALLHALANSARNGGINPTTALRIGNPVTKYRETLRPGDRAINI